MMDTITGKLWNQGLGMSTIVVDGVAHEFDGYDFVRNIALAVRCIKLMECEPFPLQTKSLFSERFIKLI